MMAKKRYLSTLVSLIFILGAVFPLNTFAGAVDYGTVTVESLKTEYAENPLGIDVTSPRLSWNIESSQRSQTQTAYRVIVASSSESLTSGNGNMWDSGRVESDQSSNIVYNGSPLQSGKRYFWKVRIWDKDAG